MRHLFLILLIVGCAPKKDSTPTIIPPTTVQPLPAPQLSCPTPEPIPLFPDFPISSKNKILNGNMNFDQNYHGNRPYESLRMTEVYSLDQWRYFGAGPGSFTVAQVDSTLPGFTKELLVNVVQPEGTLGASDNHHIEYAIEGRYIADLNWGTPQAKTVTISFWAKASKAGTKPFALMNGINSESYTTNFELAANTWKFISITVPGDLNGSWSSSDWTFGMKLLWSLGVAPGSSTPVASNEWKTATTWNVTASDQLIVQPAGSTFEMTGVQLEIGDHATSFDWIDPTEELNRLRRYFYLDSGGIVNHRLGGL